MQADEEVGKIAQAVPVIISRTLELFVESLLQKSSRITVSRNAKTLSVIHNLMLCTLTYCDFVLGLRLILNNALCRNNDSTSSRTSSRLCRISERTARNCQRISRWKQRRNRRHVSFTIAPEIAERSSFRCVYR